MRRRRTADTLITKLTAEMERHLGIEERMIAQYRKTKNPTHRYVAAWHRAEWGITTNQRHIREIEIAHGDA